MYRCTNVHVLPLYTAGPEYYYYLSYNTFVLFFITLCHVDSNDKFAISYSQLHLGLEHHNCSRSSKQPHSKQHCTIWFAHSHAKMLGSQSELNFYDLALSPLSPVYRKQINNVSSPIMLRTTQASSGKTYLDG
jgi:hypothetical protein